MFALKKNEALYLRYSGPGGTFLKPMMCLLGLKNLELLRELFAGAPIDFLEKFKFLDGLAITDFKLKKLNPIYRLEQLKSLHLTTPKIERIDVSYFPKIKTLSVTTKSKVLGLEELRHLEDCFLVDGGFITLEIFDSNKSLLNLRLTCPSLKSIGDCNLKLLEGLELADVRQLESLEGLERFPNLKRVIVRSGKNLRDVSAVGKLKKLEHLVLGNCPKVESLLCLKKSSSLKEIYLYERTSIADGNLSWMNECSSLVKSSFEDRKHYDLKISEVKSNYASKEARK